MLLHWQENKYMRNNLLKLYMKMRNLKDAFIGDQSGQDLVEYALVLALIALAATVSMKPSPLPLAPLSRPSAPS
jgi:hypothetical protein